jgi:hypothetical protein
MDMQCAGDSESVFAGDLPPMTTTTWEDIAMTRNKFAWSGACAALLASSAAFAQVPAIQSQDTNLPGFVADITEAKRSDGVLSIKLRVKNTGAKEGTVHFTYSHKIDEYYVQAEGKKYFVLRDTEKVPLANSTTYIAVAPGATYTWWAKYPAPAANVKKINFYWPFGAPFDDVPISDK